MFVLIPWGAVEFLFTSKLWKLLWLIKVTRMKESYDLLGDKNLSAGIRTIANGFAKRAQEREEKMNLKE